MGKPAARMTDQVMQNNPHCHAPIHPPAPTPTVVPHPPMMLPIIKGHVTTLIGKLPAAQCDRHNHPLRHGGLRARWARA